MTEAELVVGRAQRSPQEKPVPNPSATQDPHWGWRTSTEGTELGIHLHFKDIGRSSSQPGLTKRPPSSTGRQRCTQVKAADLGSPAARMRPCCLCPHGRRSTRDVPFLAPSDPSSMLRSRSSWQTTSSTKAPLLHQQHTWWQPSPSEPMFRPKAEGFDIRETL